MSTKSLLIKASGLPFTKVLSHSPPPPQPFFLVGIIAAQPGSTHRALYSWVWLLEAERQRSNGGYFRTLRAEEPHADPSQSTVQLRALDSAKQGSLIPSLRLLPHETLFWTTACVSA